MTTSGEALALKLITDVKASSFGEVVVKIQDGKIVYVERKEGKKIVDK